MPESSVRIKLGLELDKTDFKDQVQQLQQELEQYTLKLGIQPVVQQESPDGSGQDTAQGKAATFENNQDDSSTVDFSSISDKVGAILTSTSTLLDESTSFFKESISLDKEILEVLKESLDQNKSSKGKKTEPVKPDYSDSQDYSVVIDAIDNATNVLNGSLQQIQATLSETSKAPTQDKLDNTTSSQDAGDLRQSAPKDQKENGQQGINLIEETKSLIGEIVGAVPDIVKDSANTLVRALTGLVGDEAQSLVKEVKSTVSTTLSEIKEAIQQSLKDFVDNATGGKPGEPSQKSEKTQDSSNQGKLVQSGISSAASSVIGVLGNFQDAISEPLLEIAKNLLPELIKLNKFDAFRSLVDGAVQNLGAEITQQFSSGTANVVKGLITGDTFKSETPGADIAKQFFQGFESADPETESRMLSAIESLENITAGSELATIEKDNQVIDAEVIDFAQFGQGVTVSEAQLEAIVAVLTSMYNYITKLRLEGVVPALLAGANLNNIKIEIPGGDERSASAQNNNTNDILPTEVNLGGLEQSLESNNDILRDLLLSSQDLETLSREAIIKERVGLDRITGNSALNNTDKTKNPDIGNTLNKIPKLLQGINQATIAGGRAVGIDPSLILGVSTSISSFITAFTSITDLLRKTNPELVSALDGLVGAVISDGTTILGTGFQKVGAVFGAVADLDLGKTVEKTLLDTLSNVSVGDVKLDDVYNVLKGQILAFGKGLSPIAGSAKTAAEQGVSLAKGIVLANLPPNVEATLSKLDSKLGELVAKIALLISSLASATNNSETGKALANLINEASNVNLNKDIPETNNPGSDQVYRAAQESGSTENSSSSTKDLGKTLLDLYNFIQSLLPKIIVALLVAKLGAMLVNKGVGVATGGATSLPANAIQGSLNKILLAAVATGLGQVVLPKLKDFFSTDEKPLSTRTADLFPKFLQDILKIPAAQKIKENADKLSPDEELAFRSTGNEKGGSNNVNSSLQLIAKTLGTVIVSNVVGSSTKSNKENQSIVDPFKNIFKTVVDGLTFLPRLAGTAADTIRAIPGVKSAQKTAVKSFIQSRINTKADTQQQKAVEFTSEALLPQDQIESTFDKIKKNLLNKGLLTLVKNPGLLKIPGVGAALKATTGNLFSGRVDDASEQVRDQVVPKLSELILPADKAQGQLGKASKVIIDNSLKSLFDSLSNLISNPVKKQSKGLIGAGVDFLAGKNRGDLLGSGIDLILNNIPITLTALLIAGLLGKVVPAIDKILQKRNAETSQADLNKGFEALSKAILEISDIELDAEQLSKLLPSVKADMDNALGGGSAYSKKSNQITLDKDTAGKIASGEVDTEVITVVAHELRHAMQFAFGNKTSEQLGGEVNKGILDVAEGKQVAMYTSGDLLDPSSLESLMQQVKASVDSAVKSNPNANASLLESLEIDAEVFAQNTAEILKNFKSTTTPIEKFAIEVEKINNSLAILREAFGKTIQEVTSPQSDPQSEPPDLKNNSDLPEPETSEEQQPPSQGGGILGNIQSSIQSAGEKIAEITSPIEDFINSTKTVFTDNAQKFSGITDTITEFVDSVKASLKIDEASLQGVQNAVGDLVIQVQAALEIKQAQLAGVKLSVEQLVLDVQKAFDLGGTALDELKGSVSPFVQAFRDQTSSTFDDAGKAFENVKDSASLFVNSLSKIFLDIQDAIASSIGTITTPSGDTGDQQESSGSSSNVLGVIQASLKSVGDRFGDIVIPVNNLVNSAKAIFTESENKFSIIPTTISGFIGNVKAAFTDTEKGFSGLKNSATGIVAEVRAGFGSAVENVVKQTSTAFGVATINIKKIDAPVELFVKEITNVFTNLKQSVAGVATQVGSSVDGLANSFGNLSENDAAGQIASNLLASVQASLGGIGETLNGVNAPIQSFVESTQAIFTENKDKFNNIPSIISSFVDNVTNSFNLGDGLSNIATSASSLAQQIQTSFNTYSETLVQQASTAFEIAGNNLQEIKTPVTLFVSALDKVFTDLRQSLVNTVDKIGEVNAAPTDDDSSSGQSPKQAAANVLNAIQSSLGAAEEKLGEITNPVNTFIESAKTAFTNNLDKFNVINTSVNDFIGNIQNSFTTATNNLDEIKTAAVNLASAINGSITTTIGQVQESFGGATELFAGIKTSITTFVVNTQASLDTEGSQLGNIRLALNTFTGNVLAALNIDESSLSNIQASIDNLVTRTSQFFNVEEAWFGTLKPYVDSLSEKVGTAFADAQENLKDVKPPVFSFINALAEQFTALTESVISVVDNLNAKLQEVNNVDLYRASTSDQSAVKVDNTTEPLLDSQIIPSDLGGEIVPTDGGELTTQGDGSIDQSEQSKKSAITIDSIKASIESALVGVDKVTKGIDEIFKYVLSRLNLAKGVVDNLSKSIDGSNSNMGALSKTLNLLVTVASAFGAEIDTGFAGTGLTKIKGFVDGISSSIGTIIVGVQGVNLAIDKTAEGIKFLGKQAIKDLGEVQKAIATVKEVSAKAIQTANNIAEKVKTTAIAVKESPVGQATIAGAQFAGEKSKEFIDKQIDAISQIEQVAALIEKIQSIIDSITQALDAALAAINNTKQQIIDRANADIQLIANVVNANPVVQIAKETTNAVQNPENRREALGNIKDIVTSRSAEDLQKIEKLITSIYTLLRRDRSKSTSAETIAAQNRALNAGATDPESLTPSDLVDNQDGPEVTPDAATPLIDLGVDIDPLENIIEQLASILKTKPNTNNDITTLLGSLDSILTVSRDILDTLNKELPKDVEDQDIDKIFRASQSEDKKFEDDPFGILKIGETINDKFLKGFDLVQEKVMEKADEAGLSKQDVADITDNVGGYAISLLSSFSPEATLGIALAPFAAAMSGFGIPIMAAIEQLTPLATMMVETMQVLAPIETRFETIAGTQEGGDAMFGFAEQVANELNTPLLASVEGFSKLAAAAQGTRLEGKDVETLFTGVSKAIASLGLTGQDASLIFLALQQVISKGQLTAEEVRGQIGERLPGTMQLLGDSLGMTLSEVSKALDNGELLANVVIPKLGQALNEKFGESAKDAANSFIGSINAIENALFRFRTIFVDSFGGIVGGVGSTIAKVLNPLITFFDKVILQSGVLLNTILGIQAFVLVGSGTLFSSLKIPEAITKALSGFYGKGALVAAPFIYGAIVEVLGSALGDALGIETQDAITSLVNFFQQTIGYSIQYLLELKREPMQIIEGLIQVVRGLGQGFINLGHIANDIRKNFLTTFTGIKTGVDGITRTLNNASDSLDNFANKKIDQAYNVEFQPFNLPNLGLPEFFNFGAIAKLSLELFAVFLTGTQTVILLKFLLGFVGKGIGAFLGLGGAVGKSVISLKVFKSMLAITTISLKGLLLTLAVLASLLVLVISKSDLTSDFLSVSSNTIRDLENAQKAVDALSGKEIEIKYNVNVSDVTPFQDKGINLTPWRSKDAEKVTTDDLILAYNRAVSNSSFSRNRPVFAANDNRLEQFMGGMESDPNQLGRLRSNLTSNEAQNASLSNFNDILNLRESLVDQQKALTQNLLNNPLTQGKTELERIDREIKAITSVRRGFFLLGKILGNEQELTQRRNIAAGAGPAPQFSPQERRRRELEEDLRIANLRLEQSVMNATGSQERVFTRSDSREAVDVSGVLPYLLANQLESRRAQAIRNLERFESQTSISNVSPRNRLNAEQEQAIREQRSALDIVTQDLKVLDSFLKDPTAFANGFDNNREELTKIFEALTATAPQTVRDRFVIPPEFLQAFAPENIPAILQSAIDKGKFQLVQERTGVEQNLQNTELTLASIEVNRKILQSALTEATTRRQALNQVPLTFDPKERARIANTADPTLQSLQGLVNLDNFFVGLRNQSDRRVVGLQQQLSALEIAAGGGTAKIEELNKSLKDLETQEIWLNSVEEFALPRLQGYIDLVSNQNAVYTNELAKELRSLRGRLRNIDFSTESLNQFNLDPTLPKLAALELDLGTLITRYRRELTTLNNQKTNELNSIKEVTNELGASIRRIDGMIQGINLAVSSTITDPVGRQALTTERETLTKQRESIELEKAKQENQSAERQAALDAQIAEKEKQIRLLESQVNEIGNTKNNLRGDFRLLNNFQTAIDQLTVDDQGFLGKLFKRTNSDIAAQRLTKASSIVTPSLEVISSISSQQTNPAIRELFNSSLRSGSVVEIRQLLDQIQFSERDGITTATLQGEALEGSAKEIDQFRDAVDKTRKVLLTLERSVSGFVSRGSILGSPKRILEENLGLNPLEIERQAYTDNFFKAATELFARGAITQTDLQVLTQPGTTLKDIDARIADIRTRDGQDNFQGIISELQAQGMAESDIQDVNQLIQTLLNSVEDLRGTDPRGGRLPELETLGAVEYGQFQKALDEAGANAFAIFESLGGAEFLRSGRDLEKYFEAIKGTELGDIIQRLQREQEELDRIGAQRQKIVTELERSDLTQEERRGLSQELLAIDDKFREQYRQKAVTGAPLAQIFTSITGVNENLQNAKDVIEDYKGDPALKATLLKQVKDLEETSIQPVLTILEELENLMVFSEDELIDRVNKNIAKALDNLELSTGIIQTRTNLGIAATTSGFRDRQARNLTSLESDRNLIRNITTGNLPIASTYLDSQVRQAQATSQSADLGLTGAQEQLDLATKTLKEVEKNYAELKKGLAASPQQTEEGLKAAQEKLASAQQAYIDAEADYDAKLREGTQARLDLINLQMQRVVRAEAYLTQLKTIALKEGVLAGKVFTEQLEKELLNNEVIQIELEVKQIAAERDAIIEGIQSGTIKDLTTASAKLEELQRNYAEGQNNLLDKQLEKENFQREESARLLQNQIDLAGKYAEIASAGYERLNTQAQNYLQQLDAIQSAGDALSSFRQAVSQAQIGNLTLGSDLISAISSTRESLQNEDTLPSQRNLDVRRLAGLEQIARNQGIGGNLFDEAGIAATQQKIAKEIADAKIAALKEEQALASKLLQLEIKRNQINAQVAVREAQINKLKAEQAVLQARANLQKALIETEGSQDKTAVTLAQMDLQIAQLGLEGAVESLDFTEQNNAIQQALDGIKQQQLQSEQKAAVDTLAGELINDPNLDLTKITGKLSNLRNFNPENVPTREVFGDVLDNLNSRITKAEFEPVAYSGNLAQDLQAMSEASARAQQRQAELDSTVNKPLIDAKNSIYDFLGREQQTKISMTGGLDSVNIGSEISKINAEELGRTLSPTEQMLIEAKAGNLTNVGIEGLQNLETFLDQSGKQATEDGQVLTNALLGDLVRISGEMLTQSIADISTGAAISVGSENSMTELIIKEITQMLDSKVNSDYPGLTSKETLQETGSQPLENLDLFSPAFNDLQSIQADLQSQLPQIPIPNFNKPEKNAIAPNSSLNPIFNPSIKTPTPFVNVFNKQQSMPLYYLNSIANQISPTTEMTYRVPPGLQRDGGPTNFAPQSVTNNVYITNKIDANSQRELYTKIGEVQGKTIVESLKSMLT